MSSDSDFDAELKAIAAACRARDEAARQSTAEHEAAYQEFYKAWNEHRSRVIEPILKQAAAAFGNQDTLVETRQTTARRLTTGGNTRVVEGTYGIAILVSTAAARAKGIRETELPTLEFKPGEKQVVVDYPQYQTFSLVEVTPELVRERVLKFLKQYIG